MSSRLFLLAHEALKSTRTILLSQVQISREHMTRAAQGQSTTQMLAHEL